MKVNEIINYLRVNFAIDECENYEDSCSDCRATRMVKDLKWLATFED